MEVIIEKENKKISIAFNGKSSLLLKKLGINPETVLISRNGTLVTEEDTILNKDKVLLISVISGG